MKRFLIAMMVAAAVTACGTKGNGAQEVFEIGQAAGIDGLHAPWDGLDEGTVFRCFSDQDSFYFLYEVPEQTLTLTEPFLKERDVDPEDRVEIFFSPRLEMDIYYCAEIDPMGRVMDYKAKYYRDFDYDWNFATLEVLPKIEEGRYVVAGKLSKQELRDLGVDLGGFYMGVFRADFRPGEKEIWYSAVPTEDKSPDFHKPEVLFKACMK